jgi:hypothetical protein
MRVGWWIGLRVLGHRILEGEERLDKVSVCFWRELWRSSMEIRMVGVIIRGRLLVRHVGVKDELFPEGKLGVDGGDEFPPVG